MTIPDMINEFANAWDEWHYLAGGFAVGWTLGLIAGTHIADQ